MTGLTPSEHDLMDVLAEASRVFREIIGSGPTREADLAEAVDKIHQLQAMVMSQAAARCHPDRYRLLGESLRDPDPVGTLAPAQCATRPGEDQP